MDTNLIIIIFFMIQAYNDRDTYYHLFSKPIFNSYLWRVFLDLVSLPSASHLLGYILFLFICDSFINLYFFLFLKISGLGITYKIGILLGNKILFRFFNSAVLKILPLKIFLKYLKNKYFTYLRKTHTSHTLKSGGQGKVLCGGGLNLSLFTVLKLKLIIKILIDLKWINNLLYIFMKKLYSQK